MQGLNIAIMSPDDLIRYATPTTDLERTLLEALKRTNEELLEYAEFLYIPPRGYINSPRELEAYLDDIERQAAQADARCDYDNYKQFFDDIVDTFTDNVRWPDAQPHDTDLIEAILDDIRVGQAAKEANHES